MPNSKQIDGLIQQLLDAIPPGVRALPGEIEKNFRVILQSSFAKLDLVTREEFDAQVGVLRRTREKLDMLEKELKTLKEHPSEKS